jgi:HAE1 family hydrophobic/amphiphilic exporter-1
MKIFVLRPVATAMFFLAALVLGLYSFLKTPLELAPAEDFPQVEIRTSWPGISPEVIQTRITAPLEALSSMIKGVKKITSESRFGISKITLELDPKMNGEFVNLTLREEIAKANPALPYGVKPYVQGYVPEDFRVQPFLAYSITGSGSVEKLRDMLKDPLEIGLGSVKDVAKVEVTGGADPEIKILLDKKKLMDLGVHPDQVHDALSDGLQAFPSGRVKWGAQEYVIRISDSLKERGDLGEQIVAYSGSVPIRLSRLAKIIPSYGDTPSISRVNGQPAVQLTVLKEKGSNSLKVAEEVKKKLDQIKKELPGDLIFRVVNDESGEIQKNLRQLYLLAGIILLVVFGLIFGFLRRFAPSFIILSSIAFSIVINFKLVYLFNISLNMLTLGALALGFGMLVDDSIVVFEHTLRLREQGLSPIRAAIQGPREVFISVLASTLTVISSFFCFPFFEGRLKIYYLPLAIVMSAALATSFLVSFSLIPALSPSLLKFKEVKPREKALRLFEKALGFSLRHPGEVLLFILFILAGSYFWFRSEVPHGEFLKWYSKKTLWVNIEMPPGTDIGKTDDLAKHFEAKILEADYDKEINTTVFPEGASISISFPARIESSSRPYELKEGLLRLASRFAGVSTQVTGFDSAGFFSYMGTDTYHDSRINFFGFNLKKLQGITSGLTQRLEGNPRIKDVRTTSSRSSKLGEESIEYILKIDRDAIKRYQLDPGYLYLHLGTLLRGRITIPLKYISRGKQTDLTIKFPEADEMDLRQLQETLLLTRRGEHLRLGDIFSVKERLIASSIDRENQQFQQTLMWKFRGPPKAASQFKNSVHAGLRLPPGFSATLEEPSQMTRKEKMQVQSAVIFSLIIIYMILAALFESLIHPLYILLAVPLELVGVFLAFIIARRAFDSSAYIGIILLGGIVAKNAILIVDRINAKRRQGIQLLEAVLLGTTERIRPIVMTTSTGVLGALPVLLMSGESGRMQIWSALALCTAGGLVSSTILILVVIPIFYFYGEWIHLSVLGKWRRTRLPGNGSENKKEVRTQ